MNKTDLVKKVADVTKLSQKDVGKVTDALFGTHSSEGVIISSLAEGDKLELMGFGNFDVHKRKGRTGRNPQTGLPVEIKEKYVPKFKPGKRFNEAIPQE
jgi:DNA-binding protein HU-beta